MSSPKNPKDNEPKRLSPFDFLTNINSGPSADNLLGECNADQSEGHSLNSPDKDYNAFIINRGLSYFMDTVLYANAMNERAHLPEKMQYDFYRNAIRPRKRFSKWLKKIEDSEYIQLIMDEYDYSINKARDVFPLFSIARLEELKSKHALGGCGKKK